MGDVPPPSSSPNDRVAQEALNASFPGSDLDQSQTGFAQRSSASSTVYQPQYQHQFDPSQNAFSAQFDMTQPQGIGRGASQGPYNMGAMANALPQNAFRPGVNNAAQARYNTDGSSSGVMPQMTPYVGQSHMNHFAGQQFYMAQNAHMSAYYNAQLPPSQQQANLSSRHNMNFYPTQAMMNHAQQPLTATYYYPSANHYPSHNSPMAGNMMSNQYLPHDPRGTSPTTYQGQASAGGYNAPEGGCGRATCLLNMTKH